MILTVFLNLNLRDKSSIIIINKSSTFHFFFWVNSYLQARVTTKFSFKYNHDRFLCTTEYTTIVCKCGKFVFNFQSKLEILKFPIGNFGMWLLSSKFDTHFGLSTLKFRAETPTMKGLFLVEPRDLPAP